MRKMELWVACLYSYGSQNLNPALSISKTYYLIWIKIIILPEMIAKIGSGIGKSLYNKCHPEEMKQRGKQQINFHIVW